MSDKPIFHAGTPEPQVVYAYAEDIARKDAEIARLWAELDKAVATCREWHGVALDLRDMSITGKGDIQDHYFDAAMRLPFYGCDSDPLPSQRKSQT